MLPDPFKGAEDLKAFARLNEGRLYKLMKTCMDSQTDLKGLIKSTVRSLFHLQYHLPYAPHLTERIP